MVFAVDTVNTVNYNKPMGIDIVTDFITSQPQLATLWIVCLLWHLKSPSIGRLCSVFLAYLAFGLLVVWIPIYNAGGGPSFFGEFSHDIASVTGLDFICEVCPLASILAAVCGLVQFMLQRRPSSSSSSLESYSIYRT